MCATSHEIAWENYHQFALPSKTLSEGLENQKRPGPIDKLRYFYCCGAAVYNNPPLLIFKGDPEH